MSADALTNELRELTKKLLGYGARAPKELMLFVKNMMFLDGATATLAPDLDILGEMAQIYAYFQQHYGEQIAVAARARSRPSGWTSTSTRSRPASASVPEYGDTLTYAQVKERREIIRKRMQDRGSADSRSLAQTSGPDRPGSARAWRGSSRSAPRRAARASGRAARAARRFVW